MASDRPVPYGIGSDTWPGLSRLAADAAQVARAAAAIISTGNDTDQDPAVQRENLQEQLGDLRAAIDYVIGKNALDWAAVNRRRDRKRSLYERGIDEDQPPSPGQRMTMRPGVPARRRTATARATTAAPLRTSTPAHRGLPPGPPATRGPEPQIKHIGPFASAQDNGRLQFAEHSLREFAEVVAVGRVAPALVSDLPGGTSLEPVDCAIGRIVSSGNLHQASPVPLLSITPGTRNPARGCLGLVLGIWPLQGGHIPSSERDLVTP